MVKQITTKLKGNTVSTTAQGSSEGTVVFQFPLFVSNQRRGTPDRPHTDGCCAQPHGEEYPVVRLSWRGIFPMVTLKKKKL